MRRIHKNIGQLMRDDVMLQFAPTDTVALAVERMREHTYSCVLIVENQRLIGIFTERDYLTRVCGAPHSAEPRLAEVMTRDPDTLLPTDDVAYAINLMAVGGHRSVPVVDAALRPVGVYTVGDVLSHLDTVFEGIDEREVPWDDFEEWIDIGVGD